MRGANFRSAALSEAILEDVGGESVDFRDAWLMGTSLVHARLDHAAFDNANLGGARADEAVLHSAKFSKANVQRAHFGVLT